MENENPEVQTQTQEFDPLPQSLIQKIGKTKIIIGIISMLLLFLILGLIIFAQKSKPKTFTITQTLSGSTVHVKTNDIININSKTFPDLQITTDIQNPNIVGSNNSSFKNGNYTGSFKATRPGETDIDVIGKPPCKPNTICTPLAVDIYKIHIVVDK